MSMAEIIIPNLFGVYAGCTAIHAIYLAWEKCKAAFYFLTESDETDDLEFNPDIPLRVMETIEIIAPNKNEVYV